MKARGIFKIFAVMAAYARDLLSIRGHSYGELQLSGGRQAFYSVSASRCHTQKKPYKGFVR
jgi:hypothetical protein